MEAPKCKLCGGRHYGICKHAKPRPTAAPVASHQADVVETLVAQAMADRLTEKFRVKYDRNAAHRAYMKKYMRKRRANEKAAEKWALERWHEDQKPRNNAQLTNSRPTAKE